MMNTKCIGKFSPLLTCMIEVTLALVILLDAALYFIMIFPYAGTTLSIKCMQMLQTMSPYKGYISKHTPFKIVV